MEVIRATLPIWLREWRLTVAPDSEVSAEVKSTMLNPLNGVPMIAPSPPANAARGRRVPREPRDGHVTQLVDLPPAPATPRKPR